MFLLSETKIFEFWIVLEKPKHRNHPFYILLNDRFCTLEKPENLFNFIKNNYQWGLSSKLNNKTETDKINRTSKFEDYSNYWKLLIEDYVELYLDGLSSLLFTRANYDLRDIKSNLVGKI